VLEEASRSIEDWQRVGEVKGVTDFEPLSTKEGHCFGLMSLIAEHDIEADGDGTRGHAARSTFGAKDEQSMVAEWLEYVKREAVVRDNFESFVMESNEMRRRSHVSLDKVVGTVSALRCGKGAIEIGY
jgi:hypothetical protein